VGDGDDVGIMTAAHRHDDDNKDDDDNDNDDDDDEAHAATAAATMPIAATVMMPTSFLAWMLSWSSSRREGETERSLSLWD
jgi:hypothetical protein